MKITLNDLVKHLRHDRKVTLEEIRGNWSVASLSRFERGEIELADAVISQMAVPLGLDYEDLVARRILSDDSLEDWRSLASEMWNLDRAQSLLERLEGLKVAGMRNDYLVVATTVISELISVHTERRHNMSAEVVKLLSDYLDGLSDFSRLEGIIFSVCLEYVPLETGWDWVKRQLDMMERNNPSLQQRRRFISFCANVAERAAIEKKLETMRTIITEMRRLDESIPENAIQRNNLLMMEKLYADLADPNLENHQEFIKVLRANKLLFAPDIHQSMIEYTIAQGWASPNDFQDER